MSAGKGHLSSYSRDMSGNMDFSEQRTFMFIRYLHHPGMSKVQYKTFFHMCRLKSISFDLEKRTGTTFMLADCLQSGLLSLMSIAEDRPEALRMVNEAGKFIEELAGNAAVMQKDKIGTGMDEARSDDIDAADVISSIRLIYKTYQKASEIH